MKTEVNQLKLTVTNIKSVLLSSSEKMVKLKKDNDKLREDAIKLQAVSMKERSLESTSPTSQKAPKKKISAKSGGGIFSKAKTVLGLILGGIFVNALEGLVETLKNFYEDNAPVFNKIADIFVGFGKGLIVVWNNSKGLRRQIKEGIEQIDTEDIKKKFTELKSISDDIQKKLSPIINKDGALLNKEGLIDPKTFIEDEDNPGKMLRLSETFDYADDDDIEALKKEWKDMYYVDQYGNVRFKDTNKKAPGARFMGVGTGIEFEDIKKMLDRKNFSSISPVNKDNNLAALNNGDNNGTTVIIAKQFIEV